MMNDIIRAFEHDSFGTIRTVTHNGEPWLVGKDVATALSYKKPENALSMHVDPEDRTTTLIQGSGSNYKCKMTIINESGLYSLILSSKKPEAKAFKHWVTSDVLPTLRKHGFYASDDVLEQFLNDPDMAIGAFTKLKEARDKVRELEAENKELVQKCSYLDIITACKDAIPITVIAHDYGMSAVDMNRELKYLGIQYRMKCGTWILYQKYKDEGYTKSVTFVYDKANGRSSIHTYWTQKGRLFIYEKLKEKGILPVCERSEDDDRQ